MGESLNTLLLTSAGSGEPSLSRFAPPCNAGAPISSLTLLLRCAKGCGAVLWEKTRRDVRARLSQMRTCARSQTHHQMGLARAAWPDGRPRSQPAESRPGSLQTHRSRLRARSGRQNRGFHVRHGSYLGAHHPAAFWLPAGARTEARPSGFSSHCDSHGR